MLHGVPPAGPIPTGTPPVVLVRPSLPPATPGAKTGTFYGIQLCFPNDESINAANGPQGLGAVRGSEVELSELLCHKLLRDAGPQTPEEALAYIYQHTGMHIVGCMQLRNPELDRMNECIRTQRKMGTRTATMWHGTRNEAVTGIAEKGFHAGDRHMWGYGVYAAWDWLQALTFSDPDSRGWQYLVCVDFAVGEHVAQGHHDLRDFGYAGSFHVMSAEDPDGTMLVAANGAQVVPRYVIRLRQRCAFVDSALPTAAMLGGDRMFNDHVLHAMRERHPQEMRRLGASGVAAVGPTVAAGPGGATPPATPPAAWAFPATAASGIPAPVVLLPATVAPVCDGPAPLAFGAAPPLAGYEGIAVGALVRLQGLCDGWRPYNGMVGEVVRIVQRWDVRCEVRLRGDAAFTAQLLLQNTRGVRRGVTATLAETPEHIVAQCGQLQVVTCAPAALYTVVLPESPTPESPTPGSPTPESPTPESPTPESPTPESPMTPQKRTIHSAYMFGPS